ncbi:YggU family protein [archaeon]|jgi:uncharacterized protein|nr:YggU family protein [archaeon]MBT4397806.1 YggU family protein [archaeon]MBT4441140.1 YggU family protein [archaeon]
MKVRVKPNSKKQEVIEENGVITVYLKAQPEKGKANKELLKILKKHFKKEVRIKSGFTSKEKTIILY